MKGWVGTTDRQWFRFLRSQPGVEEVNFWFPSGRAFRAIGRGQLFFFKLKAPDDAIGGFGVLDRYSVLPLWLAWEAFGPKNGTPDEARLRALIGRYRKVDAGRAGDLEIGCAVLTQPVFLPDDAWVPVPADWKRNIVSGKGYDLTCGEGERMYRACIERAGSLDLGEQRPDYARWGAPTLVTPRLGQGAFRVAVTEAYERACAVTTEHSLPVLEAAHIVPYAQAGEHIVPNGLLLRSDVHKLFDLGYLTVTDEHRVQVSPRLRERWGNGRIYDQHHGRLIHLPGARSDWPDPSRLHWHNEVVFQG